MLRCSLFLIALFATITATTFSVDASTRVTSPVSFLFGNGIDAVPPALHLAKGGKPPAVKPKFNAAAKPKALPKAKPPTAAKPAQAPRSVTGRTLPQRIQSVKLPKQTQALVKKPAVSAAARKLGAAVKPTAKALATKPLTAVKKSSVQGKIREAAKPKQTSTRQARSASLRGSRTYDSDKSSKNAMQHILKQHGPSSKVSGKSKFAEHMTPQKIRMYTKMALRKGNIKNSPDGSQRLTLKGFKKPVGKSPNGKPVHGISVIVRNGKVMTAFPSK